MDIDKCRSWTEIVIPCLTSLAAAVYLQVHRNVPDPREGSWYKKPLISLNVVSVTLLFPEWTFAWAVKSFMIARRLVPKLEEARKIAMETHFDRLGDLAPLACKSIYLWRSAL